MAACAASAVVTKLPLQRDTRELGELRSSLSFLEANPYIRNTLDNCVASILSLRAKVSDAAYGLIVLSVQSTISISSTRPKTIPHLVANRIILRAKPLLRHVVSNITAS